MTDYGMPTLIETKTLEECASLCKELGLKFIELNMNLPQYQTDKTDIGHFTEIAEKYGIYYTIHLDENLNVSDFNPKVAKAYCETVIEAINIAKKLRVPILNMHLSKGVYFTLPDRKVYLFDEYRDIYLESIRNFRRSCEEEIGSSGIKICVENCGAFTDFQKEALSILLESGVFGLTFDIGHDACTGGFAKQTIMEHKEKLCHMHIHDARVSAKADHLALGTGELDLPDYFTLADERGCKVVLETKTIAGLRQSVEWVRNHL